MCTDISFWRQSLILSTGLMNSVGGGLFLALPSVLNPALLGNNTDIHATADQTSWITSVVGLSGVLGFIIFPFLMQNFGRKIAYLTANLCLLVGSVLVVFATNIATLLTGRIFQGIDFGSYILISIVIGEYCHPKRRGYFIVLRKLFFSVGVLLCHALALCWTWRQVDGFCIFFGILATLTNLFWPESPSYLAVKGRFKECEASYRWLNGNLRNRKELDVLISTHTRKLGRRTENKNLVRLVTDVFNKMMKKDFRSSFIISVLLCLILECGGRHYLMAYAIKIMVSLVGEKSSAVYIVIGGDCLTIVATIMSCVAVRYFKRRTLFLSIGLLSVSVMLVLSLVLFLKSNYDIFSTVIWLPPSLLVLYMFLSSFALPLVYLLIGEIFPLDYRGLGSGVAGAVTAFIYFVSLKTLPISMLKLGLSGTFLLNGLISLLCFVLLYFVLPETKDKTLFEIECEMRGKDATSDELSPLSTFKNI